MNGTSPRRHFQKLASFTLESNIRQTPRHQFDRLWPGLGTICITSLVIRALSWQLTYSSRHIADIFAGFLLPVGPRFGLIVGPRRRHRGYIILRQLLRTRGVKHEHEHEHRGNCRSRRADSICWMHYSTSRVPSRSILEPFGEVRCCTA